MYKVGDKLICLCDDLDWLGVEKGSIWEVLYVFQNIQIIDLCRNKADNTEVFSWDYEKYPDNFAPYKEKEMLDKNTEYFINVAAYAKENNLTLKEAHEEIQPWLFEQGNNWFANTSEIKWTHSGVLSLNSECEGQLCWADVEDIPSYKGHKEIKFVRNVAVAITPTVVPEEFVEFNGKQYSKAKLEQALKLIEESN